MSGPEIFAAMKRDLDVLRGNLKEAQLKGVMNRRMFTHGWWKRAGGADRTVG